MEAQFEAPWEEPQDDANDPVGQSINENDPQPEIITDPDQVEAIIRLASAVLPTTILARLFGIDPQEVVRKRKKWDLPRGLKWSKQITSDFLKKLPDLGELPLSLAQQRQIRIWRQEWLAKRKDWEKLEHEADVVARCSWVLPLRVIAELLGASAQRIAEIQTDLDLHLSLSDQRKLAHAFGKSESCPKVLFLTRQEKAQLKAIWKEARNKSKEAEARRHKKSLKFGEELKLRLIESRIRILEVNPTTPCSRCSGSCRETWPRLKEFFIWNYRSPDKLGERCVYCTFLSRLQSRRGKDTHATTKRKLGRVLGFEEQIHVREFVRAYWNIIPGVLIRRLFDIGQGTLERLYHEVDANFSSKLITEMSWMWYFGSNSVPHGDELLTTPETAKLFLLSKAWRQNISQRFEPDKDHIRFLFQERARILERAYHGPGSVRPQERKCNHCNECYPESLFFSNRTNAGSPTPAGFVATIRQLSEN